MPNSANPAKFVYRRVGALFTLLAMLLVTPAWADGQYVDLYPKSIDDLRTILNALEDTVTDARADGDAPVVVMLHGKEAHRFVRKNYQQNKAIVDQTAKLAAYDVIDVKICETWMRSNDYEHGDLFPFVSTVPYGAAELERLEDEEDYTELRISL
jgi:intracellular sulfur oxidation DsrE/DsrF family protein